MIFNLRAGAQQNVVGGSEDVTMDTTEMTVMNFGDGRRSAETEAPVQSPQHRQGTPHQAADSDVIETVPRDLRETI
jgi:hypothetical protein